MPIYTFTNTDDTRSEDRLFAWKDVPAQITVDGEVLERDYRVVANPPQPGNWPMTCDASAVHPSQIAERVAFLKSKGVQADYTKMGQPVLRDAAHRFAHHKALGYHDRNAGYSDPTPK